jgi:4-azaleucine resistance transporter AzlC
MKDTAGPPRERRAALTESLRTAWPICIGYVPIGLAFGVLGQKAGFSPSEIGLMSLLVFAGSSQFIAVSMLNAGSPVLPIVFTTFLVNLRHLLMSSSLAVHLRPLGKAWASLFAYGVTDESFAVNLTKFRLGRWHWRQALLLNHIANATWVGSSFVGGVTGQFIPAGAFGIDYALVAMFLCLLVFQLRGGIYAVTAVLAGIFAVVFALVLPGNLHIIVASVAAATIGFRVRRRVRQGEE